jgi:pimeloyl-ACP methyl ester carboxylesterase
MRTWTVPGPEGRQIVGNTHPAAGDASGGHVLIAHGFKGYKDYGFFPWLAEEVSRSGVDVHRFNFSCSGMDHGSGPFDESAFLQDTWNRQVEDLVHLLQCLQDGTLGDGGDVLLAGHSRGGVSSLLTAGRHAGTPVVSNLHGVVSLASPSACLSMEASVRDRLLAEGSLSSPSSRTGQELRIGRGFLQEQLDDPEGHDLLRQVGAITVPLVVVHGTDDSSVDVSAVDAISEASTSTCRTYLIEGANHVFNTPNPSAMDHEPSDALRQVGSILVDVASGLSRD